MFNQDTSRWILAVGVILGFLISIFILAFVPIPEGNRQIAAGAVGSLGAGTMIVIQFFFRKKPNEKD